MKICVSPMDYYFLRRSLYTIQFIFEYRGHLNEETFASNLIQAVRSLEILGSRIKIVSDVEIVFESGHPVPLRTHRLEEEPNSIENLEPIQLLDLVENIEGAPLVKIVVTHTPSRTLVGFSFSHLLGDGASFFQFISVLSRICKEGDATINTCNQRELLQVRSRLSANEKLLFDSTGYIMPRPPNPLNYQTEIIKYSFSTLAKLRMDSEGREAPVSNNDIVMADLAKRFHSSIPLHNGKFIIRCPVDYRKIIGLPVGYFGNAVRDALAIFEPEEFEKMELLDIAKRIKGAIRSVDKHSVIDSLASLDSLRKKYGIRIFEQLGCPGLLVSNLSNFPVQSVDLGIGAPIGFHHASLNPRLALILRLPDGLEVRFKRPIK